MHRFLLPPTACREDVLTLPKAEAHHAWHVLRLRSGDAVAVLDGAGGICECRVTGPEGRGLALEVTSRRTEPRPHHRVSLVQAVTKSRSMEWIVQKATELGCTRLVPVLTERSVPRLDGTEAARKAERWREIAIESVKQCGTPWLPEIVAPVPLSEYLVRVPTFELSLLGSLHAGADHPRRSFEAFRREHGRSPTDLAVWIGPEGDFTAEELAAISATGAAPITLGPLVLRAETAAVYCLSVLGYELLA